MKRTFLQAPPLPAGRPLLVVTGLMGTGKTTAGELAAGLLGLPFFDLDRSIEGRAGMTVAEVFRRSGEDAFRRLERQAVTDAARLSGAVVATGGGAVLDRDSFAALAKGSVVIALTCRRVELMRRLGSNGDRPLLRGDLGAQIELLAAERAGAYASARETFDTTGVSPDGVADEMVGAYRRAATPAHTLVHATGPEGPYPVVIGPRALDELGRWMASVLPGSGAAAVVADGAVHETIGARVAAVMKEAGLRVLLRTSLPPGESAKSAQVVTDLWTRFRRSGLDSDGVVVAVGGGAALDAAGFAAATYARGLALVNVPTTLLAMVDASLGGKVGIDHTGFKNLAGAFHHPRLVVSDPETLGTLSERTLRAGLAEAVKATVLASPLALEALERPAMQFGKASGDLQWLVEQAVRIKAAYVEKDPTDERLRHSLNLGHTFAHALEAGTDYEILHGEAVAIGLVAAAQLGESMASTPPGTSERLRRLLLRLGLPVAAPPGIGRESLLNAMAADKKRRDGRAAFIVPAPGGAELLEGVEPETALDALLDLRPQEALRT